MNDQTADQTANTQDDVEDDAAAIWAEFDQADGGQPAATVQKQDEGGEVDEPTNEVDGQGDQGGNDADPVHEQPAADDRWANAPEDMRAELARLTDENAKLAQKERSATGRYTAAQRRYDELVKAAQPRQEQGDRPTPAAALAALKDDYPEIEGPLSQAFEAINGQVADLNSAEEGRRQAAETELSAYLDEQEAGLKEAHPDYLDVLGANGPAFVAWVEDQPRAIREAAHRNANSIVDAAEAASVIGAFKAHLQPPADAPATNGKSLSGKRQRQLGATASHSSAARRPTASGIPEDGDPQDLWDAWDAHDEAKSARRR